MVHSDLPSGSSLDALWLPAPVDWVCQRSLHASPLCGGSQELFGGISGSKPAYQGGSTMEGKISDHFHWTTRRNTHVSLLPSQIVTACLEVTDAIVAINPSAYYSSLYVNMISGKTLNVEVKYDFDLILQWYLYSPVLFKEDQLMFGYKDSNDEIILTNSPWDADFEKLSFSSSSSSRSSRSTC